MIGTSGRGIPVVQRDAAPGYLGQRAAIIKASAGRPPGHQGVVWAQAA